VYGSKDASTRRGLRARKTLRMASSTALAIGAMTSVSLLAASPAGATITIPSGANVVGACGVATGGGSNFNGTKPISAAVAATSSGGTVYICPGTWTDNVSVTVPMTIEGAGQGMTTVEPYYSSPNGYGDIPGNPSEFDSTVFYVAADNVTINNLTINGANPSAVTTGTIPGSNPPATWTAGLTCDTTFAAYGEDGGCNGVTFNAGAGIDTGNAAFPGITGMTVHDVTVENTYNVGISDRSYDGTFTFSNNTITNIGGYFSQGIFTYESNGTIADNAISWTEGAITSNWGSLSVTGNSLVDNNSGISMQNVGEPAGYAAGGSTSVSDNSISSCWGQSPFAGAAGGDSELGIWFFAPFAPTAETVSGNTVTGCSTGLADLSSNNDASYATPVVTFSDNTVNGQNLSAGIGVLISTDKLGYGNGPVDVQLTDNSITNFPTALYTDETDLNNFAQCPVVNVCSVPDASLPGGVTMSASGNQFSGSWFNDASGSMSATNNWWGSTTGPSVTIGSPDSESPSALIARAAPTWWTSANETPSAPLGVSGTEGVRKVTVSWSAPTFSGNTDGSVPVTSYTVTASPGGKTCSTSTLSCTVNGLSNDKRYSFTVSATNRIGTGPSSSSASQTTAGAPGAPGGVSAEAGNASATVSWTAPSSNGGSPVTGYKVTSSPGSKSCFTSTLSCTVHGLTNGTSYTFTVMAKNAAGTGPKSGRSSARTPIAPTDIAPFAYGSTALNNRLNAQIQALAVALKSDPNSHVSLVGYTNPGEQGRSLPGLGLARANSVASYLTTLLNAEGVTGITITESYGGNSTIAPAGSPMNRRVEATIS
jgi:outer membrane protein OmpA-like peptidoglycan-associated protein